MNEQKAARNLGEEISARLGAAIIRGDYGVADQLPTEMQLSERLGVSRGAVREAIKVLAAKGLVTSRRRQGTRVTESTEWNLLDPEILNWMQTVEYSHQLLHELIEVRYAFEPEAARMVAARRELVDFAPMALALKGLEREELTDDERMPSDTAFHVGILSAAGNRFYRQMIPLLKTTLRFGHELINTFQAYGEQGRIVAHDHRELFEAMIDGRAEDAYQLSRTMVGTVLDAVNQAISDQGQ
jgi:DNA-binding FadR family transcriptional regulator